MGQGFPGIGAVIHRQGPQVGGQAAGGFQAVVGGYLAEGDLDPEGAALAGLADDPHCAAHHFGEAAGNGQPQASTAVLAGGGDIGLGEGLEETSLLVLAEADAAVADLQADAQVGAIPFADLAADDDAAPFSELHRVAGEVEQHLTQA